MLVGLHVVDVADHLQSHSLEFVVIGANYASDKQCSVAVGTSFIPNSHLVMLHDLSNLSVNLVVNTSNHKLFIKDSFSFVFFVLRGDDDTETQLSSNSSVDVVDNCRNVVIRNSSCEGGLL